MTVRRGLAEMVAVLSYLRIGRVNVQAIYSSKHVLGLIGVAIYIYIRGNRARAPPPRLTSNDLFFFYFTLELYEL